MTDLIERLKAVDHTSLEDCFLKSPLFAQTADEIDSLTNELIEARDIIALAVAMLSVEASEQKIMKAIWWHGLEADALAFLARFDTGENPNLERPAHWPPESVDPDLISARQVVAEIWPYSSNYYLTGKYDGAPVVQAALAGIKLGREQAR